MQYQRVALSLEATADNLSLVAFSDGNGKNDGKQLDPIGSDCGLCCSCRATRSLKASFTLIFGLTTQVLHKIHEYLNQPKAKMVLAAKTAVATCN